MDTIETLLTRKSSPRLNEPSPSKEELELIFQTALRAPDHASLKPWKFIKVSGEGREKLARASLSACLLYTSPSPRDQRGSRMPSSA